MEIEFVESRVLYQGNFVLEQNSSIFNENMIQVADENKGQIYPSELSFLQ